MRTPLQSNEKKILLSKQHWLVFITPIIWTIIFFALSGIPFFIPVAVIFLLVSIYKIIVYNKNIWVVTNLRVIDEQGLFSVSSKETPLDKINNVAYSKPFLGRLFDYGNIEIQSAAETGSSVHKLISRPKLLRDTITKQLDSYKQTQIQSHASELGKSISQSISQGAPSSSVADELEKLHSLREKGILSEEEYQMQKNKILNK